MSSKTKIYTNPLRKEPDPPKQHIPQYQVLGVEPQKYQSAVISGNAIAVKPNPLPLDNPRAPRPAFRQPYAVPTPSPIGKGAPPNVGNNMEHSWSAVDGDIIDDLTGADPNHPMIDNNEFMTDQALGVDYQSGFTATDLQTPTQQGRVTIETDTAEYVDEPVVIPTLSIAKNNSDTDDLAAIMADLSDDVLLLIVSGVPICSGPREEIENLARDFVFGQHEMCDGNPVPLEDVIVMKRVKIKVGVFLE